MTPEQKATVINSLLEENKRDKPRRFLIEGMLLAIANEWKDDIFLCSYCNKYFTWDEFFPPGVTMCGGCMNRRAKGI